MIRGQGVWKWRKQNQGRGWNEKPGQREEEERERERKRKVTSAAPGFWGEVAGHRSAALVTHPVIHFGHQSACIFTTLWNFHTLYNDLGALFLYWEIAYLLLGLVFFKAFFSYRISNDHAKGQPLNMKTSWDPKPSWNQAKDLCFKMSLISILGIFFTP